MFTDRQTSTTPVLLLEFDKYPVHRRISLRAESAWTTCVVGERPSSLSRSAVPACRLLGGTPHHDYQWVRLIPAVEGVQAVRLSSNSAW